MEKVEIHIAIGCPDGEKVIINGKGNEHPDYRAGDLIIIVKIKKHNKYIRVKDDLMMEKSISLIEGLCGFSFNLDHLNGQTITLHSRSGNMINNNSIMKIDNMGMPHYKD